jgi:hypothetical protein
MNFNNRLWTINTFLIFIGILIFESKYLAVLQFIMTIIIILYKDSSENKLKDGVVK